MRFPEPLVRGVLVRRYKRFLADVRLRDGALVVAHCPNSGAMTTCAIPGSDVVLTDHADAPRKLRYTWQAALVDGAWVSVNTQNPNRVVFDAVTAGRVPELDGYGAARREVVFGRGGRSRVDLFLSEHPSHRDCWVEVKSVTLKDGEAALFPDAVTERGRKHLRELASIARAGGRAVSFFLLGRSDCRYVAPADGIDREYGRALRRAAKAGVELLAYRADVSARGIELGERVEVRL